MTVAGIRQQRSAPATAALLPRLCGRCGRTSRDTAFHRLSIHRCARCDADAKQQRTARIAEREPRAAQAVQICTGENKRHLAWVRRLPCTVQTPACSQVMHAHHVRSASNAGTGMKPPDSATVSLCSIHHAELHTHGVQTFEVQYDINLRRVAALLAKLSPHIRSAAP